MRQLLISIIVFCLLFSFLGCKKALETTIINIKVVDKKTKKPLERVNIDLDFRYETSVNGSIKTTYEGYYPLTNALGQIEQVIVKDSDYEGYSAKAYKPGYLHNFFGGIEKEENNDLTVELSPRDGVLNLSVKNETGSNDTIYVSIFSQLEADATKGLYRGQVLKKYPLILSKGDSYVEQIMIATPENVDIEWGTLRPTYQKPFEKMVTIFVKDTSDYEVVF
jgi:hypothetical protein